MKQVTKTNNLSRLISMSIGKVFFAEIRIDGFLPDILLR